MTLSEVNLFMSNRNYEPFLKIPNDKDNTQPSCSNPLQINQTSIDPVPCVLKTPLRRIKHNRHNNVSCHYSIMENLAQFPLVMSALQFLKI